MTSAFDFIITEESLLDKLSDAALSSKHAEALHSLGSAISAYDLKSAWMWTKEVDRIETEQRRRIAVYHLEIFDTMRKTGGR
jgi:hypothetical protein